MFHILAAVVGVPLSIWTFLRISREGDRWLAENQAKYEALGIEP